MYSNIQLTPPYTNFFNDPHTTELNTLSLHDALPILCSTPSRAFWRSSPTWSTSSWGPPIRTSYANKEDRKSTRLNSSHSSISYAVFCLKKKKRHNLFYI